MTQPFLFFVILVVLKPFFIIFKPLKINTPQKTANEKIITSICLPYGNRS